MKNILITSVGRRVELVKIWEKSLKKISDKNPILFVTDSNHEYSAACKGKNILPICHCNDPKYVNTLLEQSIKNKVKIIVPTIDTELIYLSKNREFFKQNGIDILVSDEFLVSQCENKEFTFNLFLKLGLETPKLINREKLHFPCFMKPKKGSASKGLKKLFSENDLSINERNNPSNIFQELIPSNWIEYTADLYYSKDGKLISCVPRERIETRGGEISKGITRKNYIFEFLVNKLKFLKGARGPITVQLFADINHSKFLFIEINPRFGGGYPISHAAGVNYPELIIKEYLLGESLSFFDDWRENLLALRYDSMVIN